MKTNTVSTVSVHIRSDYPLVMILIYGFEYVHILILRYPKCHHPNKLQNSP
jgi:hypothetical protein